MSATPARFIALALLTMSAWSAPALAQEDAPQDESDGRPTIAQKTDGLERRDGLLTYYLDADANTVWLQVPPPTEDRGLIGSFIYYEGVATGLGSNPVGLDRGQIGATRLIDIRRIGGRIILEEPNLAFRALSDNPDERRAVREAFATSVLWAGEVVAEDEDGTALIDFTSFIVSDAHNVVATLKNTDQGAFSLDKDRSFVDPAACLAFPDNIELEAVLTYTSNEPGPLVRQTAPTGQAFSIVQHHSFVRLPGAGYETREFDPRMASYPMTFYDYASDLDDPLAVRWIERHRLLKTDPNADVSDVVEPIVYYVDRGAPEPIRSALVEGASWWAEAFEAAGFRNAFRVEVLPEGAHPLDVRYNVIQWVHRSTRGWSYGGGVTDPRTGEIIKGHVSLGSLRVRQDRMIFEGLLGVANSGTGEPDDPVQVSLARIRQLAAHEVGHTLGFTHNFAGSAYAGRASVMDYPAPLVALTADGRIDVSNAYGVGIGEWDVASVRFAYSQFPPGVDEREALERIVQETISRGYLFITDADARPAGAAHPLASLWDNGSDPLQALEEVLRVRRVALENFDASRIRHGAPLAELEAVLVPIYLLHRYQVTAAAKTIGGVQYAYKVNGDGLPEAQPIDPRRQREALSLLLQCMEPGLLDLPDSLINAIGATPFGGLPGAELFEGHTAPTFDALSAAATGADLVLAALLQRDRAARLIDLHRRDPNLPSFEEVLDATFARVFPDRVERLDRHEEIRRGIQWAFVDRLMDLEADPRATFGVRARAGAMLGEVRDSAFRRGANTRVDDQRAHWAELVRAIDRHRAQPLPPRTMPPAAPGSPPGDPIGADTGMQWFGSASDHWGECSHPVGRRSPQG